jgi:hypothetical protein
MNLPNPLPRLKNPLPAFQKSSFRFFNAQRIPAEKRCEIAIERFPCFSSVGVLLPTPATKTERRKDGEPKLDTINRMLSA